MPDFQTKLSRAAARVQGWRFQLAFLLALVGVLGILAGLAVFDRASPIQERTSLALMGGIVVFGIVFLIGQIVMVALRRPRNSPMARKVEEDHPELMDLFNCAVDLVERKDSTEMNVIEKRVVLEAGRKTAELRMEQSLLTYTLDRVTLRSTFLFRMMANS